LSGYDNVTIADDVSDPSFSPEIKPQVDKLFADHNGLVVTSGTRTQAQQNELVKKGIGVKNSKHVEGKAMDFRINSASMKLTKLNKTELAKYGIEDAFKHGNHVHVEFV
jgi:uncharacterized protein YcbK (DUF882 family)